MPSASRPSARLEPGRWHHVVFTYDGSRVAAGIKVYIDGTPQRLKVLLDDLNQSFQTKAPLRIGGGAGPEGRFQGLIDDVRVYNAALDADDVALLAETAPIAAIAAIPPGERTDRQSRKLRAAFLERAAPPAIRQAWQRHPRSARAKRSASSRASRRRWSCGRWTLPGRPTS